MPSLFLGGYNRSQNLVWHSFSPISFAIVMPNSAKLCFARFNSTNLHKKTKKAKAFFVFCEETHKRCVSVGKNAKKVRK